MSTVHFRHDYAKFLIECHPEEWASWYHQLNEISHTRKYAGEWLKSHKVNRLWYNAQTDMETWSIDIWGEWAGIVDLLPNQWFPRLRRLDVRAIVWDATGEIVLELGKVLLGASTGHNITVINSRPGSKRMGRDRGGQTVAIGSHKSDLRITIYKRTGEPVAQEFQMQGHYLTRLREQVVELYGANPQSCSLWLALKDLVRNAGTQRLNRVFEAAGIGTYWPVVGPYDYGQHTPDQAAFLVALAREEDYPDEEDPSRPE